MGYHILVTMKDSTKVTVKKKIVKKEKKPKRYVIVILV